MKNKIVRSILLLVLLTFAGVANAQKIYLFAEGDFNDANIGECDRIDADRVKLVFRDAAPYDKLVVYNEDDEWSGPNIEYSSSRSLKTDLIRAIDACPARGSDAIVFYWSGHGAFDDESHFLRFSYDDALRRTEILRALKRKNVRLAVLITDSCNVYQSFPKSHGGPTSPPGAAPGQGFPPLFRSLFFDCSGVVDVNSSSPNQYSGCRKPFGGFFTYTFLNILEDNMNRRLSWANVFDRIDAELYRGAGVNQIVYRWSLPGSGRSGSSSAGERRGGTWSQPTYHPENGDRIIEVGVLNGETIKVANDRQFRQFIASAERNEIVLTLVDRRSGNRYYLRTTLLPRGSSIRLGIYTQDTSQQGVLVTGYLPNYPGAKCRYLQNGDVAPVTSYR